MANHSFRQGKMLVYGLIALGVIGLGVLLLLVIQASSKRMTADNPQLYNDLAATTQSASPATPPPTPPNAEPAPIEDKVSAMDEQALLNPIVDPIAAMDDMVPAPKDDSPSSATGDVTATATQALPPVEETHVGAVNALPGPLTTRLLEPLNEDGSFNFVSALDKGYREEIDPQRNAAALLLQILPTPGRIEIRDTLYQQLGITGPPDGQGFMRPRAFLESLKNPSAGATEKVDPPAAVKDDDEDEDAPTPEETRFMEQLLVLAKKPWKPADYPDVTKWLELNRQALDDIATAVDRKRFYVPMVSGRQPEVLPKVSLPYLAPMREAGRALAARATLRLADGYIEGSIQDVMTLYRLGRLLRQPPILLCQFTGNALETLANDTTSTLANHPTLTWGHARLMIDQLRKLPGWPVADRTASMGERFMFLDAVQVAQREPVWSNVSKSLFLRDPSKIKGTPPPDDLTIVVDFRQVMFDIQQNFDDAEKALAKPEYAGAMRNLEAIDKEIRPGIEAAFAKAFDPAFITEYQAAPDARKREMMTPVISAIVRRSILPLMITRLRNEYLLRMNTGLGEISLAMAGFQRQTGDFPTRLEELSPEYLRPIPRDVFVDRSLYFSRLRDGGVMVYSVGPNLNDDGGNSTRNLDLVLRMNLPSK